MALPDLVDNTFLFAKDINLRHQDAVSKTTSNMQMMAGGLTLASLVTNQINLQTVSWTTGAGAPVAMTPFGSLYSRIDGDQNTSLYVSLGDGNWKPFTTTVGSSIAPSVAPPPPTPGGSIVGGTIDAAIIGGTTPAAGTFSTLAFTTSATGVTMPTSDNSTALATTAFVSQLLSSATGLSGNANYIPNNVTITGGAINGTVIGAITPANGTFSLLTATNLAATSGIIDNVLIGTNVPQIGAFTTLTARTPVTPDNSTNVATTAYVQANLANFLTTANAPTIYATIAGPTFTGIPKAPTATLGTNTTQIATTAFVAAAVGAGGVYNAGAVAITGGSINNTTIGATTASTGAFTTLSASSTVSGTGFTTLLTPYALLASPTFTGTPLAPTAAPGTNTTQLATTAFVVANYNASSVAISGGSINNATIGATTANTGAFTTLIASSTVSGAGFTTLLAPYASLTSPAFVGIPTAPTAIAGTNTTQLATTAFVTAAVGSGGVYNAGAVAITGGSINNTTIGATTASTGAFTTLSASSTVSGAGFTTLLSPYALLASPTFTGTPLAPTAAPGTNTTQIATTAFVTAAIGAGGVYNSTAVNITGGTINGTTIGATTASTGAFTNLSASGTISGTAFATFQASPNPIGNTTPNTGAFTTLSATSTVSGTGFSNYLASPPAIGGTTAAAGTFSTVTINHATAPLLTLVSNGFANPAFTTRSVGSKIVLAPAITGTTVDWAIGLGTNTLWQSVAQNVSGDSFLWFGGTTQIASLDGTGAFVASSINSTQIGNTTPSTGAFTTLTATTPSAGDNTTKVATTAFVVAKVAPTSWVMAWQGSSVVTNATYYLTPHAPYGGTIVGIDCVTAASTSFTVNIQIAGTSVTSLSAVAVNSSTITYTASTGANTFTTGQVVTIIVTSATGSPTNAVVALRITKAA